MVAARKTSWTDNQLERLWNYITRLAENRATAPPSIRWFRTPSS